MRPSHHPTDSANEDVLAVVVEGMSCGHCEAAIREELSQVAGVRSVDVDLETKVVQVCGAGLDEAAVVGAIDEAGYEAVRA